MLDTTELKDVFVSHSWKDKETFIEPLLIALQSQGLTYWYDSVEISPGDSLPAKLNHGFSHSKVLLLCLSENYFAGRWSIEELESAISLGQSVPGIIRVVPLMLCDPKDAIRRYPIPLAKLVYIRWQKDVDSVAAEIAAGVAAVDDAGEKYWFKAAVTAFDEGALERCAVSANRTLEFDSMHIGASLYLMASYFRLDQSRAALQELGRRADAWTKQGQVDLPDELVHYVQEQVSSMIQGDESSEWGYEFAALNLLALQNPEQTRWDLMARLMDRDGFRHLRDKVVAFVAAAGREDAVGWLLDRLGDCRDDKQALEQILATLWIAATNSERERPRILAEIRRLVSADEEDSRELALVPLFFLDPDGERIVLEALQDSSPMVRWMAFHLLSGEYTMQVTPAWSIEETHNERPASVLLTPDVIRNLLSSGDDELVSSVMEAIAEERVSPPPGPPLGAPSQASEEIREARLKVLARVGGADAMAHVIESALRDSSEFVRSTAYDLLKEGPAPVPAETLCQFAERERSDRARDDLWDLILEKGDDSLADIYVSIVDRSSSEYVRESALQRVLRIGPDAAAPAVEACVRRGDARTLKECGDDLLLGGFVTEALIGVEKALSGKDYEWPHAVLIAGVCKPFPMERLVELTKSANGHTRAAAHRALEYRRRDGVALNNLRDLVGEFLRQEEAGDGQKIWEALFALDGLIEFGSEQEVGPILFDCWDRVKDHDQGFPRRHVYAYIECMHLPTPGNGYESDLTFAPYEWPDANGPFFVLLHPRRPRFKV